MQAGSVDDPSLRDTRVNVPQVSVNMQSTCSKHKRLGGPPPACNQPVVDTRGEVAHPQHAVNL